MKTFVTTNNYDALGDIQFQNGTYRFYTMDDISNQPTNRTYINTAIVSFIISDESVKAIKNCTSKIQDMFKQNEIALIENMRTFAVIVPVSKVDVIRMVALYEHVRIHVFDSAKEYVNFDESLADII